MKESICLFLKLSSNIQDKIKELYNDSNISEDDKLILEKLFKSDNLKICTDNNTEETVVNNNINYSIINELTLLNRHIELGDIVKNKRTNQIGSVQSISSPRNELLCSYSLAVNTAANNGCIIWNVEDIELLNKYPKFTKVVTIIPEGYYGMIQYVYGMTSITNNFQIYYTVEYFNSDGQLCSGNFLESELKPIHVNNDFIDLII